MAGGVVDGQAVSAAVTDPAFIFKNADDTTISKLGLNDADVSLVSGSAITNSQREFNALWSFLGGIVNQVKTYLPTWATSNFGTSADSVQARVAAIDAAFGTSGAQSRRAARVAIGSGVASLAVVFTSAWPDVLYVPEVTIENTTDATPIFLQYIVTARSSAGFTVSFNAATDTANYVLSYRVSKAA